jgi:hypothetical protein
MYARKIAAVATFVLTLQFAIALGFVVLAWPGKSASGTSAVDRLLTSTISYISALSAKPVLFFLANLYTAVWCIPVIIITLVLREEMALARHRMLLALIAVSISAGLFLAGGIIPLVNLPQIGGASDILGQRILYGVVVGLILAATSAAGFGLVMMGSSALSTGYFPRSLSLLLILSGALEICEFAVPICLVLDPILGIGWTFWLGMRLRSGRRILK